jgi:hypothetical protein
MVDNELDKMEATVFAGSKEPLSSDLATKDQNSAGFETQEFSVNEEENEEPQEPNN